MPWRDSALTLVSMYGMTEDGYADTVVNRLLSDLTPLFDSRQHAGRIVLGGDLNITTQWTGAQRGKHHVELHDYVDSRVPVLDRMHTKRLPAYATLGFDVPTRGRRSRHPRPTPETEVTDAT